MWIALILHCLSCNHKINDVTNTRSNKTTCSRFWLFKQTSCVNSQSPDLTQEHVLRILLSLRDLLSELLHLGVLWSVGVNLVLQLLVLVQKLLRIGQTVGDVFWGHRGLGTRQPLLEVIQVSKETLQLASLSKFFISLSQLKIHSNRHNYDSCYSKTWDKLEIILTSCYSWPCPWDPSRHCWSRQSSLWWPGLPQAWYLGVFLPLLGGIQATKESTDIKFHYLKTQYH